MEQHCETEGSRDSFPGQALITDEDGFIRAPDELELYTPVFKTHKS